MRVRLAILVFLLNGIVFGDSSHAADCGRILATGEAKPRAELPPLMEQNLLFSCGPVSLLSWLHWERPQTNLPLEAITEKKLIGILKATDIAGTDARDFVAGARSLGLRVNYEIGLSLSEARALLEKRSGLIVNIQLEGEGHWALLAKITDTHAILMDPWEASERGYRKITIRRLYEIWYGREGARTAVVINQ